MTSLARRRFLVVGFDGLRPDLIRPDLTPNLCRLKRQGVTLERFRSVFPSDTRVAFPSSVTGASPGVHGAVGNRFIVRGSGLARYVDTALSAAIDELEHATSGHFLDAPSLGEILAAAGGVVATLSTDSAGSTHILNHKAARLGHITLSGHFPELSTPSDFAARVHAALGPPPAPAPEDRPETAGQTFLTDAFLRHVWPEARPDLTMIWYSEPDRSSHNCGTGHPTTLAALRHCDHEFGRLLDWWEAEGRAAGVQLVTLSDHGHVTARERVSASDVLTEAGFRVGARLDPGVDVAVVSGQTLLLYFASPTERALNRAARALMERPWCGPLFGPGGDGAASSIPGLLSKRLVMADHPRSPDLYLTFRSDDRLDAYGLEGGCFYEGASPPGGGTHGGLHPRELAATFVAAGDAFVGGGWASETPAGVGDLAPTILSAMGLAPKVPSGGRVLEELLADNGRRARPVVGKEVFEARCGAYRQRLRRLTVDRHVYLDGGWADEGRLAVQQIQNLEHASPM